jgi:hypothetical protein
MPPATPAATIASATIKPTGEPPSLPPPRPPLASSTVADLRSLVFVPDLEVALGLDPASFAPAPPLASLPPSPAAPVRASAWPVPEAPVAPVVGVLATPPDGAGDDGPVAGAAVAGAAVGGDGGGFVGGGAHPTTLQ